MKNLVVVVILGMLSSLATANPWCHAYFQSEQGANIQLDYQAKEIWGRFGSYFKGINPYIHLQSGDLVGDEVARVVFMELLANGSPISTRTIDMYWNHQEQRFTAMFSQYGGFTVYNNGWNYAVELAFVVDGVWHKDPISRTSNFLFRPYEYDDYCANPDPIY